MAKQLNVSLAFNADTMKAKAQIQDLQNTLNQLVKNSTSTSAGNTLSITQELMEAQVAATKLQTILGQSMNPKSGNLDLTKFSESFNKAGMDLEKLKIQLDQLGPTGQKAFMSLASSIVSADVPLRRTNKLVSELWTTMKNTARWQLSSSVLHGFMGTIQSATSYAKDLDKSLNNIRIVTGQSAEEMALFAERANKAAKALSATTTEYTNASLIYYQQGLNDQEVQNRADVTIKMAHASGQSAEIVSDQLTAVWNNFYDGSKSLEYYADVMTALGAATASSSDEIAGGLEKFAAIGETIGLSYEYAASALATITANTRQSEDVVGTALKTIFARIQGLSLGETLEDGVTLNKYSEALAKVGISIFDANGELKKMDTILDEMGNKWDYLNNAQQVALAQTVAGVRQYNQLTALMENWDNGDNDSMQANLATSYNSEGELQRQADVYAESWQGARDRVKAAAQDIYDSVLDPEFFITLLDGFEKLLSGVANFTDALNGLPGVLSLLGAILTKTFSQQLIGSINNMAFSIKSMVGVTKEEIDAFQSLALKEVNKMSFNTGTEAGDAEAAALKRRLQLQNDIRSVAEGLTEEQREQLVDLLKINDAYAEQAIKAAQAKDAASDKVQNTASAMRSDIRRAVVRNDNGEELSIDQKMAQFAQAQRDLRQEMQQGVKAGDQFKWLTTSITDASKNLPIANKYINELVQHLNKVGRSEAAKSITDLTQQFQAGKISVEEYRKRLLEITTAEEILDDTILAGSDAFQQRLSQYNLTQQQCDKLANEMMELAQSEKFSSDQAKKAAQAHVELKASILGFKNATDSFGQNVVKTAQGISSLLMAFNSFKSIWDTLNNPDMSGGEKVLAIMTSLAMAIPSLVFGLQALNREQLKKNAADLIEIKNGAIKIVQKGAEVLATKAKTLADKSETAAIWAKVAAKIAELAASVPLLLITLAIVAAIGTLVAVSWLLVKAFKAWKASTPEGQLETLKDEAEKAADAFNRVQEEVNETKSAIENLNSSYDTIANLTKGTDEWYEAITKVNAEVMKLMELYPDLLAGEVNVDENGMLSISDEGIEKINNSNRQLLQAAANNNTRSQINVKEKEIDNSFLNYDNPNFTFDMLNANANYTPGTIEDIIQQYYENQGVGEQLFTREGADTLLQGLQQQAPELFKDVYGYDTYIDPEAFYEDIMANANTIRENAAQRNQIDVLKDSLITSRTAALGSNRTADEVKEIMGATAYDDIIATKKSDIETAFGDWNDSIDYKKGGAYTTDEEWKMIEDFMSLKGGETEYVAQKGGKMVLSIDGEEKEFSKDEVFNSLAELYSGPEWETQFEQGLRENLKTSLGNAVEDVDLEGLTAVDNFRKDLSQSLIGTEFEGNGDEFLNKIIGEYTKVRQDDGSIKEYSMPDAIKNFQADTEFIDTSSIDFTRLTEQLASGVLNATQFKDALQELNTQGEILSMSEFFSNAAEALGLDEDAAAEMQAYAEHLRSIAKESEDLDDRLAEDAQGAADLAVEITRMNKGIDDLANGFEDWQDVLKKSSKESAEYAAAMKKTKKALSDVLDVEEDLVSDDFVTQHFKEIAKAAEGDEEAIDSLRSQMDEEIIQRISLTKPEAIQQEIAALDSKLKSELDRINAELPDIDVGAVLQDQAFLDAANNLVTQAGMTADEANAYFAGIGYEPVYSTTDIENANAMQIPDGSTELSIDSIGWSDVPIDLPDWFPGDHTITLPKITYSAKPVSKPPVEAEADMSLTSFSGDGTPPQIKGLRKKATGSQNNYSSSNSGGGSPGSGGKGGGGGSKPKKASPTKKSDIIDRYKEVEDQLDDITDAFDDASKAADRLYGVDKLKKMKETNSLLQKEIGLLKQKKSEAQKYLDIDFEALQTTVGQEFGLAFEKDANGNLSNYDEVMGELYRQLNELETKAGDEWDEKEQEEIDALKEKIDKVKEAIDQFDETRELIEDLDNDIQDKIYEWQDANYEMLQLELELKLEVNEAQLKKLEYFLNKYSDNFYKMAESAGLMRDSIEPTIQSLNDYRAHKEALDAAYSKGEISQADYIEGLKEVREGYYDNLEALIDLDKQMMHYYGDTLDAASEELASFTDHMEHLTDVFDHYVNLMDILGKSKNYEAMGDFLGGKADTIRDRLDVAKEYYEMLKENSKADEFWANYQAALESGDEDMAQWWKEQWDAEVNALDEAQAEMLSLTEEWAEAMKAIIENNMAKISDTLEKSLTNGLGFDKLMDDFDKLNTRQEEYLTKTNQIYETNKLMRTASKALDETDNKVAKQKLKNFIDETKSLQENTQLSKYELEIQQAKYDLLLAEIALEEAQNAKSTVRLSRDNEGNFGYVYTADQDAIADAEQKLDDAENNLYNISLNGQQEYTEKYLQAQQQMFDELDELWRLYYEEGAITQEEYNQRYADIQNHYYGPDGVLTTYANLYNIGVQTDANATADNWQKNYGAMTQNTSQWAANVNTYYEGVQEQIGIWEEVSEQANEDVEGALNDSETATKDLKDESQRMADTLTSKVIPAIEKEIKAVQSQTAAYAAQRAELLKLIEEYENYLNQLNQQVSVASVGFDKDTDYSALMNEYLNKGGKVGDATYNELLRQRNAKIDWLETQGYDSSYWGTRGDETTTMYNALVAGGSYTMSSGKTVGQDWYQGDYVADDQLAAIFEALGVPLGALEEMVTAIKETTDAIKEATTTAGENTVNKIGETSEATNTKIGESGDNVTNKVSETGEATVEKVGEVGETTSDSIAESTTETVSTLNDVADVIKSGNDAIVSAIGSAASTIASSVGGAISSIRSDVSALSARVSAISASMIMTRMATGGYTGEWGPEGKLAILDEKELVLNKDDTGNILQAVSMIREISDMIDIQAGVASLFTSLSSPTIETSNEVLEQMVTIHAEFPNATNHSEIEEAFNNLVNRASQYANRK